MNYLRYLLPEHSSAYYCKKQVISHKVTHLFKPPHPLKLFTANNRKLSFEINDQVCRISADVTVIFRNNAMLLRRIKLYANIKVKVDAGNVITDEDQGYYDLREVEWHSTNTPMEFIKKHSLKVNWLDDTKLFPDPIDELLFLTECVGKR